MKLVAERLGLPVRQFVALIQCPCDACTPGGALQGGLPGPEQVLKVHAARAVQTRSQRRT